MESLKEEVSEEAGGGLDLWKYGQGVEGLCEVEGVKGNEGLARDLAQEVDEVLEVFVVGLGSFFQFLVELGKLSSCRYN